MNSFEREQLQKLMTQHTEVQRIQKLLQQADPLSALFPGAAGAAMRAAMEAEAERERLLCLARGARADEYQARNGTRPTDVVQAEIQRQLASYEAAFKKSPWDSWLQDELRRQIDAHHSFAAITGHTGLLQLQKAVEARHYPWVSELDAAASVRGFAEIQVLGEGLKNWHPFSLPMTLATRSVLGDWTCLTALPHNILSDAAARSAFYLQQGYDPAIADFPRQAFEENLVLAGFRSAATAPIDKREEESEEESAKRRTSEAQATLSEFERELREFINTIMTARYGARWTRQRVNGTLVQAWTEKRDYDRAARKVDLPLIEYADFTDYERIIIQNNNWEEIFKAYFQRKESVKESFVRLRPLRASAMHSRYLTQDDFAYLAVEIRRLRLAITSPTESPEDDDASQA